MSKFIRVEEVFKDRKTKKEIITESYLNVSSIVTVVKRSDGKPYVSLNEYYFSKTFCFRDCFQSYCIPNETYESFIERLEQICLEDKE